MPRHSITFEAGKFYQFTGVEFGIGMSPLLKHNDVVFILSQDNSALTPLGIVHNFPKYHDQHGEWWKELV